jgi:hypothetical protein
VTAVGVAIGGWLVGSSVAFVLRRHAIAWVAGVAGALVGLLFLPGVGP